MTDPEEREVLARIESRFYEAPDDGLDESDLRRLLEVEDEIRAERRMDR